MEPMPNEESEKLRQECHRDLAALRGDAGLSERAYRLFERLVSRLDRLETGSFSPEEKPTAPERKASAPWSNEHVLAALQKKDG
jgi:hypothetical protein